MALKQKKEKITIGRKEKIQLPDFGLKNLDAKVDTGAYSSSLHCKILGPVEKDGIACIRFIPLAVSRRPRNAKEMVIPISKIKNVKSSSGHSESRYFVKLNVGLGEEVWETEFSLTNRSSMKYTILLGRKFLKGRFVVDVAKSYVFYKKAQKRIIASKLDL